ncbi:MAG: hypothetical protein AABZ57_05610 [Candidatus Margulisiibacteriota bacterium]
METPETRRLAYPPALGRGFLPDSSLNKLNAGYSMRAKAFFRIIDPSHPASLYLSERLARLTNDPLAKVYLFEEKSKTIYEE